MKKAKSNLKKLVKGLNKMAAEEFNYKKAITEENKKFEKGGLKARQKKVVADLEKEYGTGLKNNKEGGSETMTVKGSVKQAIKVKKTAKVVPKVNMARQEQKAISLLNELKSSVNCDGLKLEFSSHTKSGYCSYKAGRRMVFATKFNSHGSILPVFNITEKEYKELGGKGKFGDWWTAEYNFKEKDDKLLSKFAEVSLAKLRKPVDKPKPKVTKAVVKMTKPLAKPVIKKAVKEIVRHI